MKKILLLLLLMLVFAQNVSAANFDRPNNKFGIHLAQPHLNEIKKVADMVNGNGGDWGYVTLVIEEQDRNRQKWQEVFDLLRDFHLIPIIRLATKPEGNSWRRPNKEDADSWAEFLNSLNWVVKNRYIVLFNEPNHGLEWGGNVDAFQYATTSREFAKKLKEKNSDFFVMMAGFDASAPNSMPMYLDEETYLRNIFTVISPDEFEKYFDGISSHSYPNPAFSGSPYDSGKGTIRTYQWEEDLFRSLGVNKTLPVFITETGWRMRDEITTANNFKTAYESVWLSDSNVIAVTPFVYDYQGPPFLEFSWKRYQSDEFYAQYYMVKDMQKTKGVPEVIDQGEIEIVFPHELVAESSYHFTVMVKNKGQAIWDIGSGYDLKLLSPEGKPFDYIISSIKNTKPGQDAPIAMYVKTNTKFGSFRISLELQKNNNTLVKSQEYRIEIVPLPHLEFKTELYPKLSTDAPDFTIQIFDEKEGLVFEKKGISVRNSWGIVDAVQNIILGKKYRIVLLKQYYLPRQDFISFKRGTNILRLKRMFPLDFNVDGHFDWSDLGVLFQKPEFISLLLP